MTIQFGERVLIDGTLMESDALTEPLAPVLKERGITMLAPSSALWRGYVASWVLRDGQLWLFRLVCPAMFGRDECDPTDRLRRRVTLATLFPGHEPPIFADWFSGTLALPFGDEIAWPNPNLPPQLEYERRLSFEAGRLLGDVTERFSRPVVAPTIARAAHPQVGPAAGIDRLVAQFRRTARKRRT